MPPESDAKKAGPPKAASAAQQRERAAKAHRWTRFGIQAAFFVLAPGAFSGAFNGVKYLFTQIGDIQAIQPTAFLALLVALLAFTVVFGRFFCGYACAFGTLGDVLYAAFGFLRRRTGIPELVFPPALVKVLSLCKFAVLAAVCLTCAFGTWSAVSGMSPWVAFASMTNGFSEGVQATAWVLLALIAVGMVVRERFFCQFLCPLGALFSLMPQLGFSEFTRTKAHCARSCGRCRETCPVGIWPDADTLAHGECIACGRCADACPMANVNLVAIERAETKRQRLQKEAEQAVRLQEQEKAQAPEDASEEGAPATAAEKRPSAPVNRPLRKTREAFLLLRGTEPGVMAAKALLLLAVLWAVGATRYLPAFSSFFG